MNILLCNDDGFEAEGIKALDRALSGSHTVWTIAPDSDRSGCAHMMTIKGPIKLKRVGSKKWSCSGSPVDCVILSTMGILPQAPDLVISGINRGPNLGTDLLYSGTAAAARQAALFGIPGIALSLASYEGPFSYEPIADWISEKLDDIVTAWERDCFININFPLGELDKASVIETKLSKRTYVEKLSRYDAPDGYSYCFFDGCDIGSIGDADSDFEAVRAGSISLSRVSLEPDTLSRVSTGEEVERVAGR